SHHGYWKYEDHKASAETGIGQGGIIERIISIREGVRGNNGSCTCWAEEAGIIVG
ncbi:33161_t:CDS:1, partial [Gigaspora margarita]